MMLVRPQFEADRKGKLREINKPDPDVYMQIGYNRSPDDGMMHYRYLIDSELEKAEYIEESPFEQYDVLKGQNRGLDHPLLSADKLDDGGNKSTIRNAGKFKGLIRIIPEEKLEERRRKVKDTRARREEVKRKMKEAEERGELDY